jgi:hypothetical protein
MKKLFFISFFVFFFLIIFSNSVSAQSCNCIRTGYFYDDVTKEIKYYCQAQTTYCANGGLCQCPTLYSTDKNAPCDPGACLAPSRCEDLPNAYCISECNLPIPNQICDSGLKCCSITVAKRVADCVSNCNTQCVFGNNLPGFTCKIESGARGTQTCACYPPSSQPGSGGIYNICQGNQDCLSCVGNSNAWTAIGCITTSDPQAFVTWLLGAAIGLAGGIAVLLIIFGGFLIILSSGDPQRLQAGKEILSSAIIGLIVIIFAVFLLRIIGVEILKIPGFE